MKALSSGGNPPPTRKKQPLSARPSLPYFSCNSREQQIITYILQSSSRFNVRAFSDYFSLARSTVKDAIKRLIDKGLLLKVAYGSYQLSDKGKEYAKSTLDGENVIKKSGGNLGWVGRAAGVESEVLSQHDTKFTIDYENYKLDPEKITKLGAIKYKKQDLGNLSSQILYFENATVIITKHKITLFIREVIGDSSIDTLYKAVTKANEIIERLHVDASTLKLENAHYARVESVLAAFLERINGKYQLELENGKKFWIDRSTGPVEDETDDQEVRERIDDFLKDVLKSKGLVSDIDKLKEVVSGLVTLKVMEYSSVAKESPTVSPIPSYIR